MLQKWETDFADLIGLAYDKWNKWNIPILAEYISD